MDFDRLNRALLQKCSDLSIEATQRALLVSIAGQKMALFEDGHPVRAFTVSTSAAPPSCIEDSHGTPTGLHRIAGKIGAGEPAGSVFRGRRPIGLRASELSAEEQSGNLITSRILRLEGLEPGHNSGPGRDSFERFIYVHGTNHEDRLGRPFSGGCVEMLNAEVIELYELVEKGDQVYIGDPG